MARLDIKGMPSREVNRRLRELIKTEDEITIVHPDSMHNMAAALIGEGRLVVEGSTGFYTGDFLEGPSLVIKRCFIPVHLLGIARQLATWATDALRALTKEHPSWV